MINNLIPPVPNNQPLANAKTMMISQVWSSFMNQLAQVATNFQTSLNSINGISQLTGDVSAGPTTGIESAISVIQPNVVSNSKLAAMAAMTFKGNNLISAGNAADLTPLQATAMLNVFNDVLKGLAPPSGGGTTNFLRADGTWNSPAASGSEFHYGSPCTTLSSAVTSASFTTTSNSPTLSFTPTLSGTYKVYAAFETYIPTAGTNVAGRIFNSSGGASLLVENQSDSYSSSSVLQSMNPVESIFTLTAGIAYSFDIQIKSNGSNNAFARGDQAQFSIIAERMGA